MTALFCWFNREDHLGERLWVCSDSKLSGVEGDLLSSAAKIFVLPVNVYGGSHFETPLYRSSVIFGYSGSSLVALNTYAALNSCLSDLKIMGGQIPSIDDLANFASKIITKYTEQLSVLKEARALSSIIIAGFCPRAQDYVVAKLVPCVQSNNFVFKKYVYFSSKTPDDYLFYLGSHESELLQKVRTLRSGEDNFLYWWRAPATVIKNCVESEEYDDVGGYVQLATCFQNKSKILALSEQVNGAWTFKYKYLGFPLWHESMEVGDCFHSINPIIGI